MIQISNPYYDGQTGIIRNVTRKVKLFKNNVEKPDITLGRF